MRLSKRRLIAKHEKVLDTQQAMHNARRKLLDEYTTNLAGMKAECAALRVQIESKSPVFVDISRDWRSTRMKEYVPGQQATGDRDED